MGKMKTLNNKITLNLNSDAEVSVKGFIAPIEHTAGNFHRKWDALANLRAAEPEQQYSAAVFRDFLPAEAVSVGECWEIKQAGVQELLEQLHPKPSLEMRAEMYGLEECKGFRACLRAYSDQFVDIVFRIHAEFALTDGWFTPSQFAGHLIIDRAQETIVFFLMHVPAGTLNFDVNWETILEGWDAPRWITDGGYCSQMELRSGTQDVLQDTEFTETITQEEAERLLIQQFYKSQRINWVSLEEALRMTQAQQKPVHVISLDGPLTDEAC
ncbi:hypothetical protein C6503_01145 [Candidatus Poribacteria bacterium]|nr:MAG: hypothetical protein C6503_01145 [Candidatus Poribacteria bacterium]